MSIKDLMNKNVVRVSPDASVREAASIMKSRNVGCVVIQEGAGPVGVLTDRDIVTRAICDGRDVASTRVSEVMTHNAITLHEELGLEDALEKMRQSSVRRFPVTNSIGVVTGFISLDDLMRLVGKEMAAFASILERQVSVG